MTLLNKWVKGWVGGWVDVRSGWVEEWMGGWRQGGSAGLALLWSKKNQRKFALSLTAPETGFFFYIYDVITITSPEKEKRSTIHYLWKISSGFHTHKTASPDAHGSLRCCSWAPHNPLRSPGSVGTQKKCRIGLDRKLMTSLVRTAAAGRARSTSCRLE
jgi:hypothetical protein